MCKNTGAIYNIFKRFSNKSNDATEINKLEDFFTEKERLENKLHILTNECKVCIKKEKN